MNSFLRSLLCMLGLWLGTAHAGEDAPVVVIAHANVARVDAPTLQRLYMGRTIELAGVPVIVVNQRSASDIRQRFLRLVLDTDEERYTSYWTVRRHVGKGAPPREFSSAAELIAYVQATPGAIGYVAATDVKPGMNVIYRTRP
jgi:ABC-type phosphate transport system substrate-binding protein